MTTNGRARSMAEQVNGYVLLRRNETLAGWSAHDVLAPDADPEACLRQRMEAAQIPGRWAVAELRTLIEIDHPEGE